MSKTRSYYINGIGAIAPQDTLSNDYFLSELSVYEKNVLTCITPDLKAYVPPAQLRRLGRMLRIGLATAIICLHDAHLDVPDGIITSTGYGSLEETEKFLIELLERHEKQLTPTYFAQGTYNSLAGLIGLATSCRGYNNTYVSRGFAFEGAIQDSLLQLSDDPSLNFLVGSFDEAADVLHAIGLRSGHFKTEPVPNLQLFNSETKGTIQGEGSAFFVISGTPTESTWCEISGLQMVYSPGDAQELAQGLGDFLEENKVNISEIDVWVSGASGDIEKDRMLKSLETTVLQGTAQVRFKHLCGEYCTAVSFGLWLGANVLKKQLVPDITKVNKENFSVKKLKTILMVNHYMGKNFSFCLLKK